jgi:electron-transferring-flavoprotein dehydrogenase
MMHPYFWRYLKNGTLRSWGAKSLQESGKRGEPFLVGNGYARIGEGSGSTNVLTGSGVDEAWETGRLLAEAVVELLDQGAEFSKDNLDKTYVRLRRESWVEKEGRIAERSRDGFTKGFVTGLIGMALTGLTGGRMNLSGKISPPHEKIPELQDYYRNIDKSEMERLRAESRKKGLPLHDALMTRSGWPEIPYDGRLLISQQDALLLGGKVQAAPGYADHVVFLYPALCEECAKRVCVEICSGQAIQNDPEGGVRFDREKCVHCGACMWNCSRTVEDGDRLNLEFRAGSGGLHSAEN